MRDMVTNATEAEKCQLPRIIRNLLVWRPMTQLGLAVMLNECERSGSNLNGTTKGMKRGRFKINPPGPVPAGTRNTYPTDVFIAPVEPIEALR